MPYPETRVQGFRKVVPFVSATLVCLMAATAQAQTVQLSDVFTALPSISDVELAPSTLYSDAPGGHEGVLTLELEDDYDAVQIGVLNSFAQRWGIERIAVSPSANYGPEHAIGSAAYDLDAQPVTALVPIQWSNGGAHNAPPGIATVSLPASAPAQAGQPSISFASTTSPATQGGMSPLPGWYAADGRGCVPAGARVRSVTATGITLTEAVSGTGCGAGQAIYFSPQPLGPFAQAVPPSPRTYRATLIFSDWLPLHSVPRTDGGFAAGMAVSAGAVAAGTTLVGTDGLNLILSKPLHNPIGAQAPVTLSTSATLASAAGTGATVLALKGTTAIRAGQTVTGNPGIAPSTHVVALSGDQVTLDTPVGGAIPAGTTLSFSNKTWAVTATDAGATEIPTVSTTGRPLLHIRFVMQPGFAPEVDRPGCVRGATSGFPLCEAPLNLPQLWTLAGGQVSGRPIDGIDYATLIGAGAGSPVSENWAPTFFVRFLGRHAGATLLICGAFQSAGTYGSVSSEAGPGRIGAAWASLANPSLPVSVVSVASRTGSTDDEFANCETMLRALQPSMLLIQDYSNHNGTSVSAYRAQVQNMAQLAQSLGTKPIIYIGYAEASANIGGLPVTSAADGTEIQLATGANRAVAVHGAVVTGPGVPAGTTGSIIAGGWKLKLSRPASVAAGSELRFVDQVGSTTGTTVTLTAPSYISVSGAGVHAHDVPLGVTITTRAGSANATLSEAASIPAGTIPVLSVQKPASVGDYVNAARWFYAATDSWATTQLDGLGAAGTDPNNYGWLCDGCSTVGGYANDYGNSLIAAKFVPLLQKLTGQSAGN